MAIVAVSGAVVLIVVAVIAALALSGSNAKRQSASGPTKTDTIELRAQPVVLEAESVTGMGPFTPPAAPHRAFSVLGPSASPRSGAVPPKGAKPADLYGGSGDDRVCDREKIVRFLSAHPAHAKAWGAVLRVDVASIPQYVRSLTPTTLLYDTRVTNHGYESGKATPKQMVLQAGTAVLVDGDGKPVVRCKCGNPLTPAEETRNTVYVGQPWAGFAPTTYVVFASASRSGWWTMGTDWDGYEADDPYVDDASYVDDGGLPEGMTESEVAEYPPDGSYDEGDDSGDYDEGDDSGSYDEGDDSGDYDEGDDSGSYDEGDDSGSYDEGDDSGSYDEGEG